MPPSHRQLKKDAREANALDNPLIRELLQRYRKLETQPETRQTTRLKRILASIIEKKIGQHADYPFKQEEEWMPPWKERIQLGVSYAGSEYFYDQNELVQHLLIAASTGAGKTTTVYQILDDLTLPYWCIDYKKDYRHLLKNNKELIVLPEEEMKFNPMKPPPGVETNTWKNRFINIFCDTTELLSGSKTYLAKYVDTVYNKYEQPTLHDLHNEIKSNNPKPGVEQNYHDRILNRLYSLLSGTSGQIFSDPDGYNYKTLLSYSVVFELKDVDEWTQKLIPGALLEWLFQYRSHNNPQDGKLRNVFVVDECKKIFNTQKEHNSPNVVAHIDDVAAKIRGYGVGIIAADQEPLKLSRSLRTNTKTKILLATYDHQQLKEIMDSLGLSALQRDIAQRLQTGDAIIQLGNQIPSAVAIEEYELSKDVTDQQVKHHLEQHSAISSPTIGRSKHPEQGRSNSELPVSPAEQAEQPVVDLSEDAEILLKSLAENPFKPLTAHHYKKVSSSSPTHGSKAKAELLQKEVVNEEEAKIPTGRRTLLEITDKGEHYLEQEYDLKVEIAGRGGIVHQFWQHILAEKLEDLDWVVGIEKLDADVYGNNSKQELVVEVAMGKNQREIEHVKKHLDRGIDQIVVGCYSKPVQEYLQSKLKNLDQETDAVHLRQLHEMTGETELFE